MRDCDAFGARGRLQHGMRARRGLTCSAGLGGGDRLGTRRGTRRVEDCDAATARGRLRPCETEDHRNGWRGACTNEDVFANNGSTLEAVLPRDARGTANTLDCAVGELEDNYNAWLGATSRHSKGTSKDDVLADKDGSKDVVLPCNARGTANSRDGAATE